MNNTPIIKIGIIAGTTNWLPSEIAVENRRKLTEVYIDKYGEENIYECSVVLNDNEVSIKRALREIRKAECNAVCLYWANYGPESAGTLFVQDYNEPIMIIAAAEEGKEPFDKDRKDSLSGLINACYSLKLRNTKVYIPDNPCGTYEQCADNINAFFSIARTLKAIRELKLISFGPRPSTYLAASAPNHLLYDIGVEVTEFSELELYDSFNKHRNDARIEKIVSQMEDEVGGSDKHELLNTFAQYELTIEDWIRNYKGDRNYVTLTSTCWPAFPVNFGFVPCYVNSRLTAKGYPVSCEVDAYGAISEYIGQCISGEVVTILNINNNIPFSLYSERIRGKEFNGKQYELGDLFLGYHCGVTPSCRLNSSELFPHFVNSQLIGEEKSHGTIQGSIVPGQVTLLRIQGTRDNKIRAYVCQGQILPVEEDTYGGRAIIAVPEMERFIRNVILEKQYPNHCAVIFGHYGKQLITVLKQMGVSEIDYNHPKEIPYNNENTFYSLNNWF